MQQYFLRIACKSPVPPSLSDFGVPARVGESAYCLIHPAAGVGTRDQVRAAVAPLMATLQTVGVCTTPAVRALFFDMDSTVVAQESIVEIAAHAGCAAEVAAVTESAMRGELDFTEALARRVALLRGLPAAMLAQVRQRLMPNPGIRALIGCCRARGVPAFLVSGGFTQLAVPLAAELGFSGVHANVLGIRDGLLTGTIEGAVVDGEAKKNFMLTQCRALGISPADVAAIGDGANDIPMLRAAGVAVGYMPKPVLQPLLDAQVGDGDHRFLAALLFGASC